MTFYAVGLLLTILMWSYAVMRSRDGAHDPSVLVTGASLWTIGFWSAAVLAEVLLP